ncbi:hypothetical protein SPRG_01725 [Saprolegnia parasitica CBS 223.65]|uniref:Pentacotripeptide-repeat region of PRORP domain-containing protein n=1 Tax=Saprolegnia parasitica (strain CBS 223.65) TaxID=695850 RepID=A0A067D560_SAPPC|nr:hypothetical protein SPRG_01725 [Saprolegnia parasitica CBS 223.65]KDO33846.1 hypothetical protein SPRG_01725 [Saprolegnia parasitica CBS 223.65]|eukprot:XP_012195482.1 hypothetical protein SPRG_01725 [Saprolegnia parasitica CBS 223.65]
MQRVAKQGLRRWISSAHSSPLTKHFNENPEKAMAVFRGLDTLGMVPDAVQVRGILVTLSRGQHAAEVREVLEYAIKRDVAINWNDFFRSGVEHAQSSSSDLIALFESAVAINPSAMPTSSYITMIRQCLKTRDVARALSLYKHIEGHDFKLHQLNKSVMRVLSELSDVAGADAAAVAKAQNLTLDMYVHRTRSDGDFAAYLEAILAVDHSILVSCLRMILRKDTSPVPDHRHDQIQAHIADATPIFEYCSKHDLEIPPELFTWYFLKCKRIHASPSIVVTQFLAMMSAGRVSLSVAACMSAVHSCIGVRENQLAIEVLRVALAGDLPMDQWHYNTALWLCSKTTDSHMALALFNRMRLTESIAPSEKTLTAVLLNLRQSTTGWDLPTVLAYFAQHQIKPTSWEYSQLVEILSSTPSIAYPVMEQLKPSETDAPRPPTKKKASTPAEKALAAADAAALVKPKRTSSTRTHRPRSASSEARRDAYNPHSRGNRSSTSKERRLPKSWQPRPASAPEASEAPKAPEPKKESSCSIM